MPVNNDPIDLGQEELLDINIDIQANVLPPKHDLIIIVDADTLAYSACAVCEEMWLIENPDGDLEQSFTQDIDRATKHALEKMQLILDRVGGKPENVELHFTGGKSNFRYGLLAEAFPTDPDKHYKAKRADKKHPKGLYEVKTNLLNHFVGQFHYNCEADDYVVWRKKVLGDKAILAAVDKDVLKNIEGCHWNYYDNSRYNIPMQWVNVSEEEARFNQYMQAITGDRSDNVPGLDGIGPKKALRFICEGMDEEELWGGLKTAYMVHCTYGDPVEMAILNMRLVNMHQFDGEDIKLWEPPTE